MTNKKQTRNKRKSSLGKIYKVAPKLYPSRTTISLGDEAVAALQWIRDRGIPLNINKLCSAVVVNAVKSLKESLTPADFEALEKARDVLAKVLEQGGGEG